VVALLHAGHARADIDDDAGALVAQDGREQPFGVGAGKGELVGVTDTRRFHLDQHLSRLRPVQVDLRDHQRLCLLQCDGGTGFHGGSPPPVVSARIEVEDASKMPTVENPKGRNEGGRPSYRFPPSRPNDSVRSLVWVPARDRFKSPFRKNF
jgi:hypothetical protein